MEEGMKERTHCYDFCIYILDPTVLVLGIGRSISLAMIEHALHDVYKQCSSCLKREGYVYLEWIDHYLEELALHRVATL